MSNFLKRTITGAAFVIVLLGCTIFSYASFAMLFFIITLLGVWEFYTLAEKGANKPQKVLGTIAGGVLFVTNYLFASGTFLPKILIVNIPLLFLIFIVELYTKRDNPFRNIAFTVLGIVYVALPLSLLNYIVLSNGVFHYQTMLGFYFMLWASDTGAYLFGSKMGKRKLFPRVSPGKTWEGSVGGAMCSLLVAFILARYYTHLVLADWVVIALILVIVGTLGDLVESLYKRSKNVKDSGTILPGHGGILDRFDSLLLSAPFVFCYLQLIN